MRYDYFKRILFTHLCHLYWHSPYASISVQNDDPSCTSVYLFYQIFELITVPPNIFSIPLQL